MRWLLTELPCFLRTTFLYTVPSRQRYFPDGNRSRVPAPAFIVLRCAVIILQYLWPLALHSKKISLNFSSSRQIHSMFLAASFMAGIHLQLVNLTHIVPSYFEFSAPFLLTLYFFNRTRFEGSGSLQIAFLFPISKYYGMVGIPSSRSLPCLTSSTISSPLPAALFTFFSCFIVLST